MKFDSPEVVLKVSTRRGLASPSAAGVAGFVGLRRVEVVEKDREVEEVRERVRVDRIREAMVEWICKRR